MPDDRTICPLYAPDMPRVPIETARYYGPPRSSMFARPSGTFTLQNGFLYLIPYINEETVAYDRIYTHINTQQAGKFCRMGIWRVCPDTHATADIVEQSGDVSLNVAPTFYTLLWGRMEPGPYVLGIASDATTALLTALDSTQLQALGSTDLSNAPDCHWRKDIAWTSGTSLPEYIDLSTLTYRRQNPPMLALRALRA